MKNIFFSCFFSCLFAPFLAFGQKIQLAPPQLRLTDGSDFFFEKRAEARLVFDLKGAEIRYTLDGSEPTEKSALARDSVSSPLVFKKTTTLRAAAFHPDFEKSASKKWHFERLGGRLRPDSVAFYLPDHRPAEPYLKNGAAILFDGKSGSPTNFSDGHWLGYEGNAAIIFASFSKKKRVSKVRVHFLVDEKSWIFPPRMVDVLAAKKVGFMPPELNERAEIHADPSQKGAFFFDFRLKKPFRSRHFLILIEDFGPLPDGHAGAGHRAWLFLDEIVFEK